jgi:hypothetical protein
MIEVIGPKDREEYRFALKIADDMRALWPDLEDSEDRVQIAASAKVYGGPTQDIDIIVLAQLNGRRFRPRRPVMVEDASGQPSLHAAEIAVWNLLLTIEVKGHHPGGVRFDGLNAIVRYGQNEKSATDQAMDQMTSLRGYIGQLGRVHPWVINLVAFENLPSSALPARPHNLITADMSFAAVLTALCELRPPRRSASGRPNLSCCKDEIAERVAGLPIFTPLQPTPLDRKRMERLSASSPTIEALEARVGASQLILRGHGGAGKTSLLLQLAKRAYDERAARSLLLTYNQALAADIRRLMALAAIPSSSDQGGVRVETVMSFVNRVLRKLDLFAEDEDALAGYEDRCDELARMLDTGALTAADIEQLMARHPEELRYDHVLIDEGQDWPSGEIGVIRGLFGLERLIVADGIDQFVRGDMADWRAGVEGASHTERLKRSLRMKANLARFANAVAEAMGAPGWKVTPSTDAPGGRVIILEGPFGDELVLHHQLMRDLKADGNAPIDCLYCVPPSKVQVTPAGERESIVAAMLKAAGQPCWDGASKDVRRDIPRDIEAARIVQYQSCRGLEGWTVVTLALDEFWAMQKRASLADHRPDTMESLEEFARRSAARWLMIPLSRAMDTLVIQIDSAHGELGAALRRIADRMPDIVEWRR